MDDILRPLDEITLVLYFKKAKLQARSNLDEYNDFLMIKVKDETEILLNITTGEDLSINYKNVVQVIDKVTEIKKLYEYNPDIYQDTLNIGKIESVVLYKDVDIYNSVSDTSVVEETDIIEIKDIKGTTFYIDILFNKIYKRKEIYNIQNITKKKQYIIFKSGLQNKFNVKLFNNLKFKLLSMIYDFE